MTYIAYSAGRLNSATLDLVEKANIIIEEYQAQGFTLTLRQLYYQFVSRDLLPNTLPSYKRLGVAVKKERRAGLISWDAIEDRTRNLITRQHWDEPRDVIEAAKASFAVDMWANQPCRPEVWVEKDALTGVLEPLCRSYDTPFFASRGNNSETEQEGACRRRFGAAIELGQRPIILHLADHDPNGLDMTRDIRARSEFFTGLPVEVRRLALNRDQVERFDPPPNFAKETDTRFKAYAAEYGPKCWELDALPPSVITGLIEAALLEIIDPDLWEQQLAREDAGRALLQRLLEGL
jgi:hypothetical protein